MAYDGALQTRTLPTQPLVLGWCSCCQVSTQQKAQMMSELVQILPVEVYDSWAVRATHVVYPATQVVYLVELQILDFQRNGHICQDRGICKEAAEGMLEVTHNWCARLLPGQ